MRPDTGESTASIKRRMDDEVWWEILGDLARGGLLRRVPKLGKSYLMVDGAPSRGGISDTRLRRLLREGALEEVALDTYRLAAPAAVSIEGDETCP
jgi:hypothetical protein